MIRLILVLYLCTISCSAFCTAPLAESELRRLTQEFIEAKNGRQQPNSTKEDVEHFLSFLTDDIKDQHVNFNVEINSKDELRSGMLAKLNDKIFFSNIDILEIMVGRNVTFVKFKEHAKGQPSHMDKPFEYTAINIMALEFNELGKIKRIRRHHGL